jgi:tryptophan synthase alpha chain
MTKSLINETFENVKKENRPALLTYIVAGDYTKNKSFEILKSISNFADICELGFPHNTPIADGGQIQTSSHRAIKNGTKIKDVFKIVKDFKSSKFSKPVILMGYFNMILQYGQNKFLNDCKKNKIDGLIIVDLPWPENKKFANKCRKKSISFVQLISPTTSKNRLNSIIKDSHNMIYYISMLSTTGGKLKISPKKILKNYYKIKRINPKKNCVIGFGITDKTISKLKSADGLVVGSALCKKINESVKKRQNPVINVTSMVKKLQNRIL